LHQDRFSGGRAPAVPFLLDSLAQDSYPLSTRRFNLTPNEVSGVPETAAIRFTTSSSSISGSASDSWPKSQQPSATACPDSAAESRPATIPQIYGRLNVGGEVRTLPPAIAFELGIPLPFELSRRLPLQPKLGIDNSWRTLMLRRCSPPGAGQRMIAKLVAIEHRVYGPAATLRTATPHRLQNFRPHANVKQLHPLVRGVQNPRIVPGQTTQIRALYTEIASGLDEVAEMPCQHN
jgi:hypothetical protein